MSMKPAQRYTLVIMGFLFSSGIHIAQAQGEHQNMTDAEHRAMQDAQHMNHNSGHGMDQAESMSMDKNEKNDMSDMRSMNHGAMQRNSNPDDARDPHAYSGGYTLESAPYDLPGPRQLRLADEHSFGSVMLERLEAVRTSDNTSVAYDLQAWYGRDYNRAVFKSEGEYDNRKFEEMSTELSWSHAVFTFWNTQLGLRYDSGEGSDRPWLALGIQGLAPYWFEVDVTAYVGEQGRTALSVQAEYELLLTQRLILQPQLEAELFGKDDRERGIGPGLSSVKTGLRLRYEIRRELAPYVGVEWAGMFGDTADYAKAAGMDSNETMAVVGLRLWF